MQVTFLIRTLNEERDLQSTLDLIIQQEGEHAIEIVIVDSGSIDSTIKIAEDNNCKVITMTKEEWSWGSSLNYGFRNAKFDYVVIISAHCFLSTKNFLNNLEILIDKNKDVAAFYGQQLPLDNYDPFEEYELKEWYPNINILMKNENDLTGISNACSIVKKEIWKENKYDETVDSLEDGIWANNIIKHNTLMYSSEIGVYHSHKFNPEYIYRKWYWRTYESENFTKQYIKNSLLKQIIKFLIFKPYLLLKTFIEICKIFNFLKNKYDFIKIKHIFYFVKIKNKAILNAYYDFKLNKNKKSSYWKLNIPSKITKYSLKFKDFLKYLNERDIY